MFNSRAGQIKQCHATATMFLRSCVTKALCRGDGPRHSLQALAECRCDHNGDLIFLMRSIVSPLQICFLLDIGTTQRSCTSIITFRSSDHNGGNKMLNKLDRKHNRIGQHA